MTRPLGFVFVVVLGLALALVAGRPACADEREGRVLGAAVIVEANGIPITRADLDEALAMDDDWRNLLRAGSSAANAEMRRALEERVLSRLIDEILLTEEAKAKRIAFSAEEERDVARLFDERVKRDWGSVEALEQQLKAAGLSIEKLRARHRSGILVRKLFQEEAGRTPFVRPTAIREFFELNKDQQFRVPGVVELSQIVVKKAGRDPDEARRMIGAAAEALKAGKPFAEVVKGYPEGPYHDAGGKMTVEHVGHLRKDLQEIIATLKPGETSEPLDMKDAWRIIRLERHEKDRYLAFEDVQDKIYQHLEDEGRAERFEQLRERIRQKAFIRRR